MAAARQLIFSAEHVDIGARVLAQAPSIDEPEDSLSSALFQYGGA